MGNTPNKSYTAYRSCWQKLDKMKIELNKEAEQRSELNITLTAIFVKMIASTECIPQTEFDKYVASKNAEQRAAGRKEPVTAKSFVLPDRVKTKIETLASSLAGTEGEFYNVISYAIDNSPITKDNYF